MTTMTSRPPLPSKKTRQDRLPSRRFPDRDAAFVALLCGLLYAVLPLRAQAVPGAPTEQGPAMIEVPPDGVILPSPKPQVRPQKRPKLRKPWVRERVVRLYVSARPFFVPFQSRITYILPGKPSPTQFPGGAIFNVGFDYQSRSNFWVGLEIAPLIVSSLTERTGYPYFNGRLTLGYAGEKLAIGGTLGGGLSQAEDFVHVGVALRFGRLRGTHARLRLETSVYSVTSYPVNGDLEINIRVPTPSLRLQINVGGNSLLTGIYTTIGVQYLLHGDGGPGSDILVFGAGIVAVAPLLVPGPLFTVGYERRW